MSVSAEEREAILDGLWAEGRTSSCGVVSRICSTIPKPTRSRRSTSATRSVRRSRIRIPPNCCVPRAIPTGPSVPPIDTEYYETFDRDNVSLVDIRETPIEAITATGLRTTVAEYAFDAIVFATGFDAMTGSLLRMDVRGAGGLRLADAWANGPRTLLGLQIAGFPNLFTITGPGSPSVLMNMPVAIEYHVDWIADCKDYVHEDGWNRIEATEAAQDEWVEHVAEVGQHSLFGQGELLVRGANIPGKPRVVMPYAGGEPSCRERCTTVDGYGIRRGSSSAGPHRTRWRLHAGGDGWGRGANPISFRPPMPLVLPRVAVGGPGSRNSGRSASTGRSSASMWSTRKKVLTH